MSRDTLTPAARRDIEESFKNSAEAHTLLDLINSEFQSDPHSTACFDSRIVERVKRCVQWRNDFNARNPRP